MILSLSGLGACVRGELIEVTFVRVADDYLVGVDRAELVHLYDELLRQSQQRGEEVGVRLEYLDELHHAAVSDVELSVQPEGPSGDLGPVAL